MPLDFSFLKIDIGEKGEKKGGRKIVFTQAVPRLGISVNLVKSPKKLIFAELSWSKVEVVPKYQLAFLNFLHQSSSPSVQPNWVSSVSFNLPANTSSAWGHRETRGQRAI